MKKRVFSVFMALILMFSLLPTIALAGEDGEDGGISVLAAGVECAQGDACTTHAAAIGRLHYNSPAEAVDAAAEGQTVTLLQDVNLSASLMINQGIVLDLHGNDISTQDTDTTTIFSLSGGTADYPVTITDDLAASHTDAGQISTFSGITVQSGYVRLKKVNISGSSCGVSVMSASPAPVVDIDGANIETTSLGGSPSVISASGAADITILPGTDAFPTTISLSSTNSLSYARILSGSYASSKFNIQGGLVSLCLLYTSPSPRDCS